MECSLSEVDVCNRQYCFRMIHFLFTSGHCRNPQTEAFLEMLGLGYCLDTFTESMGLPQTSGSLVSRGK